MPQYVQVWILTDTRRSHVSQSATLRISRASGTSLAMLQVQMGLFYLNIGDIEKCLCKDNTTKCMLV